MSWQAYVDTNLIATGRISEAAICGQQGGIWAASAGLNVTDPECIALVAGFRDQSKFIENGIRVAGVKYLFLKGEDGFVVGKKGSDTGIVVYKTNQALIIAICKNPQRVEDGTVVVGSLADYLKSQNY